MKSVKCENVGAGTPYYDVSCFSKFLAEKAQAKLSF